MIKYYENYLYSYDKGFSYLVLDHKFNYALLDDLLKVTDGKIVLIDESKYITIQFSKEIYKLLSKIVTNYVIDNKILKEYMLKSIIHKDLDLKTTIENEVVENSIIENELNIDSKVIKELLLHSNIDIKEVPEN